MDNRSNCSFRNEPCPTSLCWAIAVGAYVMGISWYARNESYRQKEDDFDRLVDRIPILFLFGVPMLALAYLVLWNNLDPVRVFLVKPYWTSRRRSGFFCHSQDETKHRRLFGYRGFPIARRYLCGRCHTFLPCTAFSWALCAPRSNCSYFAKEVCGNLGLFYIVCCYMPNNYSSIRRNVRLDFSHEVFLPVIPLLWKTPLFPIF